MYPILYLVAFIEGFCTLAVELLAIRILIPVVGSSVVLTGVVLSVILLALSLGYEYGGRLAQRKDLPRILIFNLSLSGTLYAWGLFLLPRFGDEWVHRWGLSGGLLLSVLAALAIPVFLASCTLPMLVQMVSHQRPHQPGRATGRLLLLSTLGSVAGGLLPPLLLFGRVGVEWTAIAVVLLLWLGALAISSQQIQGGGRRVVYPWLMGLGLPALLLPLIHSPSLYRVDTAYQRLEVVQAGGERRMYTNGQAASGLFWPSRVPSFSYIREALRVLSHRPLHNALFVGAAGMVLPEHLKRDRGIDTLSIDLDPAVYKAAEAMWGEALRGRFAVASARAFVRACKPKQYDLVFLDTFSGNAPPPETLTLEYLSQAQTCGRWVMANAIMDRDLQTNFSHSLLATARAAWGRVYYRQAPSMPHAIADNFLLSNQPLEGFTAYLGGGSIYRDNRHSIEKDWLAIVFSKYQ